MSSQVLSGMAKHGSVRQGLVWKDGSNLIKNLPNKL